MAKLSQIIAIRTTAKARAHSAISELYKKIQKGALFSGFYKEYRPKDEDGEKLPSEAQRVQALSGHILLELDRSVTDLMQITARQDWTNAQAKADVIVGDKKLLEGVPVSYLIFLEKQLTDIHTFINGMPVLDPSEDWSMDDKSGLNRTREITTHRTKKVQKAIVMYPHSEHHPAQTQMVTEDVVAGHWVAVKLSGAMSATDKAKMLGKVDTLLYAVKSAREAANSVNEVPSPKVGAVVFGFIFGPQVNSD